MLLTCLLALPAEAGADATRAALDRVQEILELRLDDGLLAKEELLPAIVVSVAPRYTSSEGWYPAQALRVLAAALGDDGLRMCEACSSPRTFVAEGALVYQAGPVSLEEVARLDEAHRGDAAPARSAIWLDEQRGGVSIRIVDLRTARLMFAQNIDPTLVEVRNSGRLYSLSEELERRARGDDVMQAFIDVAVYPEQHVSLDWTDQWGKTNANLTGLSISVFDPLLGFGAAHYRRVDVLDALIGAKVLVSMPTATARALGQGNIEITDPLVTAVGVLRVPFGRSNFGALLTASTNGRVGIGLSLLNFSLLPVLP